jgi:hypothetical protein
MSWLQKEAGKNVSAGQYHENGGYKIFLRLPGSKKAETYSPAGDLDAPWGEDIPSQVKHSR